MSYLGNLPVFDHKTSEWSIVYGKLTQFLRINNVTKEEIKSGILLTHLTDETYRLVRNLAYPNTVESLTYNELVQILNSHFKPKQCSFVDKANFFGATRSPGESLGDWAARLRGLASHCEFGDALETNLRDRFVLGLGSGPERDKLFEQNPTTLTLTKAIEIGEQAACAREVKVMLNTSDFGVIKEEPVYRAKFHQFARGSGGDGSGNDSVGARTSRRETGSCSVCGMKNHYSDKCRYKSYKCQKCGIKGHLKKVCAKNKNNSCAYHIQSEQECGANEAKDTGCVKCQNFNLRDKVEEELNRLVTLGILVPIDQSEYATPIVPVLKENNKIKIAGDFSVTLNKDLLIERYPLPRIEEVFAKIGGGERYSKIDLKNAYNQFVLDELSQLLTTINTHKGLFKYTRLVYGLSNAPAIFQKAMETLLSGIDGVSVWLDDICITGPNSDSHIKRLEEVLSRLSDAGLRLQRDKCDFFKDSVKYLGYVIDKNGLKTDSEKVHAIINAPEPTNVTEVKRFLGMVNYYRNFIPNASSLLHPLHELLRRDTPWEWGEHQRRSMAAVRRELASERVLAHFEPTAQLVLNTVHCTTGETPAKLMFGRNLRSRLDLIIPIEKTQLNMPLVTSRRFFEIGDTVWARWYSARKETWELGTIKEKVGSKMYKIFIIKFEATCIRHIDQLLKFTGNDNSLKINNTDNVESRNFQSLPLSPSMPVNAPLSEPFVGNPRSSTIVEQPVNTDAIDDVNGEEWGDYSAQDSVRDSTEIPEASDSPEASENGVEQPQSDSVRSNDVPPAQAPTPARQLRPRKGIDYKKYFK
ncbi:unnamed protein product [Parnassius mnemosyne]|uniref:Reverse transcriptase domain-containing protein n=2 Tax=Parnassius mnemosyne TaxID=213953 RepID=A0AAV1K9I2_9NEOP